MEPTIARQIAHYSHASELDRFGQPWIEHVERVAAAVPADARTIAFLHDVLERTDTPVAELLSAGLTTMELQTLRLLTREPGESYEAYILRVAYAPGSAGALARIVKLADVRDHLAQREPPHAAPPYGWAHRHIANGQARLDSTATHDAAA